MAPANHPYGHPMATTPLTLMAEPTTSNSSNSYYIDSRYVENKKETKKERIKRIATEKMHASWKKHNQKTETIIQIKQICKPKHRMFGQGFKNK